MLFGRGAMKNLPLKFVGIFVIVFAMFTAGCPNKQQAQKTIRDFKVKSAELSVYGTKLIQAFGDSYRDGLITQDQLRTINQGTGVFVQAVGVYRQAIAQAEAIVNSGQPLPANTLDTLQRILNDQVIDAFFDILVRVGGLSIAKSEAVKAAITAIKLTILAIQGAFPGARGLLNNHNAQSLALAGPFGGKSWIG